MYFDKGALEGDGQRQIRQAFVQKLFILVRKSNKKISKEWTKLD